MIFDIHLRRATADTSSLTEAYGFGISVRGRVGEGYCAKMLRKWGLGGPIYVSAKRTHRFRQQKEELNNCEGKGSDRNLY
jgi:hypothetical protein